jgi:L-gulono-1,4-lactone dehydrogenase
MAKWENWAKTVKHTGLEKVYKPKNLKELKSAVKEAAGKGWKLRAVGSGHAWSNLGVPSRCGGAVILTENLDKILSTTGDTIEVQGGITIKRLNNELFKLGLALDNMGDSNPQAIAGAVANETHGSGAEIGSISEFIEGMTIVKANGEEQVLEGDDLKAGRVARGLLGVVYSVKLRVRPKYFLHHDQVLITLRDENIPELIKNRHLEYWYYPYTGKAERITREIVDSTKVINPLDLAEEWFIELGAALVNGIGKNNPQKLPAFWKDHATTQFFPPVERQGPSHKILLGKSNVWRDVVRTFTMEYQLDVGANLDNFWKALDAFDESIEVAKRKCVFVASPVQIRFTKKSERSLLSHMRFQPTASFSISFFRDHDGAHTWLPELEKRLRGLGGLPHWGKMFYVEPEMPAAFETIRKKFDPDGVFAFRQGPYNPDPEAFQGP